MKHRVNGQRVGKRAVGRPRLPDDYRRDCRVTAYFTRKEVAALRRVATGHGMSVNALIRRAALGASRL